MSDVNPIPDRPHRTRRRDRGNRPAARKPDSKPTTKPSAKPVAGEKTAKKRKQRSMVCPSCGKFQDVTSRSIGSTFDCYCGHELTVPPPPPAVNVDAVARDRRLRDLRKRQRWISMGVVVAFTICIVLLSAAIYISVMRQLIGGAIFTGLVAIGFLVAGAVAASENRRLKAEIAGELA